MSTPGLNSPFITLRVQGQEGNKVFFRIKRSTQLKKLMKAYCNKQALDHFIYFDFRFDGGRIKGEQTPDELEMEDGDQIDVFLHCNGGSPV